MYLFIFFLFNYIESLECMIVRKGISNWLNHSLTAHDKFIIWFYESSISKTFYITWGLTLVNHCGVNWITIYSYEFQIVLQPTTIKKNLLHFFYQNLSPKAKNFEKKNSNLQNNINVIFFFTIIIEPSKYLFKLSSIFYKFCPKNLNFEKITNLQNKFIVIFWRTKH